MAASGCILSVAGFFKTAYQPSGAEVKINGLDVDEGLYNYSGVFEMEVYLIAVKNETGKNFLISQIFDVDLEKDATYKFRVVSDYVKGYEKYER